MAKKLVQNITAREEDFAQWYTDVVREAKLCDYSGVKGCMNYLPNGYALWENIQKELDARFKETGVENVYLPVMIPESLLQKMCIRDRYERGLLQIHGRKPWYECKYAAGIRTIFHCVDNAVQP